MKEKMEIFMAKRIAIGLRPLPEKKPPLTLPGV